MATTRSTVKSKKPRAKSKIKSKNSGVLTFLKRKPALVFIVVFGLVGSIFLFRSFAATTNLEAEGSTKTAEVVIGSDASASGGKYAQFATAAPLAKSSAQRFPGDPNPRVTGKAYWGSSLEGGADPYERHEVPTGKPLPLRRTFFGWSARATSMVSGAKTDLSKGRLPWVSIKPPSWAEMASGSRDKEIDEMLIALDNIGGADKPVWFTVHHEPEGGGGSINGGPDDTAGAAGWRGMQKRVRERINALKSQGKPMDNIAFAPILMGYTFDTSSGRNPNDWWVDGIWDFYGIDVYCYESCSSRGRTLVTNPPLAASVKFVQSKNIPMGIGEWGETNSASVWAQVMRDFWEYGFKNNIDLVGYSAFDSGLNPPAGTTVDTTMPKEVLSVFHDILKNDPRVIRVSELGGGTTATAPSTYGTLTSNVSVPTDGTYKLWVRMSVPDSANNAISAKFDNGASAKIGDFAIPANTWTWVDYENGNTADKATFNLVAGTRKITITGIEKGVKVDKFILTDTSCIPTGNGDNCTVVVPPPTTDLPPATPTGVKVTSVGNGEVTITWNPNTESDFYYYSLRFKKSTDADSTYVWPAGKITENTYKFTGLTNGAQYDLEVRNVDQALNKSDYVTVVATPKLATTSSDTTAPTTPTNLTSSLNWNSFTSTYAINLGWGKSTDNVGVKDYIIRRNGVQVGTTTGTTFSDKNLAVEKYTYSVRARDSANNVSSEISTTKTIKCFLVWCSLE
jgi:hypothetical protein